MRLTIFGPGHPFRGGISSTTTGVVRALGEMGHDTLFLTPRRQYPGWLYPGGDDRDPQAARRLECAETALDPMNPWSWRGSARRALRSRSDAWIFPYWTWAWAGLWRALLAARQRPPTVAIVHNPCDHDGGPVQRWAARSVLGRCDGLFTHAVELAKPLRQQYPELPVGSHPLAVEAVVELPDRQRARADLGLPAAAPVALFFGLIRPYKGVDLLLDALASDADGMDRWRLVVAGEAWGGLGDALRRQVAAQGLEKRVKLRLGWVPQEQLATLFAAADVVVLPYRSGSQSAVAAQALAHGVPVLSTGVGGLPEIVRDGVNGRLVEAGSAGELARGLASLDEQTLRRFAAAALAAADQLSWRSYAAALVELVQSVAADRAVV